MQAGDGGAQLYNSPEKMLVLSSCLMFVFSAEKEVLSCHFIVLEGSHVCPSLEHYYNY